MMDIEVKALVFSQAFWDRIIALLGLRLSRFPREKKAFSLQTSHFILSAAVHQSVPRASSGRSHRLVLNPFQR